MMDVFGVNHVFLGLMGGNGQDVKTPTITLSHLARWYFTGEVVQEKEAEEERNVAKQTKAPRGNIRTTNPITANKPVSQVHTRKQVQDLEHIFNELSNHSECCTMAAIQRRCGPSGESIYLTKSLVSADPEIVTLPEWLHFFRTNRAFQNDRFALDAFISDVLVSVEETKQPTTMAIQIMAPAEVPVHDQYDLAGVNKPQSRKQHASHASKSSMDVSGRLSISIQEHETPPLKIEPRLIVYGKIPSDKEFDMTVHEVRVLSPVAQREVDSENSPTYAH
jgi:hypothetical protein